MHKFKIFYQQYASQLRYTLLSVLIIMLGFIVSYNNTLLNLLQADLLTQDQIISRIHQIAETHTRVAGKYVAVSKRKSMQQLCEQVFGTSKIDTVHFQEKTQTCYVRLLSFREAQLYRFLKLAEFHNFDVIRMQVSVKTKKRQLLHGEFTFKKQSL